MITKESGECLRRLRNNPLQEKTENMRNTNVTIRYTRKLRMHETLTEQSTTKKMRMRETLTSQSITGEN